MPVPVPAWTSRWRPSSIAVGDRLGHLDLARALLPAERLDRVAEQLAHTGVGVSHSRTLATTTDTRGVPSPGGWAAGGGGAGVPLVTPG